MTDHRNEQAVWPDELMIRDTGIHDDAGGKGQRIYTTAGFGYEKVKNVRADLYARPQPAAPQVPEGRVLVSREDANNLARFAFNNAGRGLRSYLRRAAERVQKALDTPPAPEQKTDAELLAEMEASGVLDAFFTFVDGSDEFTRDGMIAAFETSRAEQPKPAGDVEALAVVIAQELADIDGMDFDDLHQLRWSGGAVPEPVGDAWSMDYYPKGERIARRLAAQPAQVKCWCLTCRPQTLSDMRFVVCPTCGNKRCPHANNHRNACTGSNEVGQPGSSWEHVKPAQGEGEK